MTVETDGSALATALVSRGAAPAGSSRVAVVCAPASEMTTGARKVVSRGPRPFLKLTRTPTARPSSTRISSTVWSSRHAPPRDSMTARAPSAMVLDVPAGVPGRP